MKTKFILLILLMLLMLPVTAFAETIDVEMTKIELENDALTRFEFSNGLGFETNLSEYGGSSYFAIFIFDDNVQWNMVYNGKSIEYENRYLITETGYYELTAVSENEESVFDFTITDEYFEGLDENSELTEDENRILNQLFILAKNENIKGIDKVTSADDIKITENDTQQIKEYLDSGDFTSSMISSIFGKDIDIGNDINKLGEMLLGVTVEDAEVIEGYDAKQQLYTYTMPNGEMFLSNIPNNSITSSGAQVFFNSAATAMVYKDDEDGVLYNSGDVISEEGSYIISIVQTPSEANQFSLEDLIEESESGNMTDEELMEKLDSVSITDKNNYICSYSFNILKKPVNNIEIYNVPENFVLAKVMLNGRNQDIDEEYAYKMVDDGVYTFVIESVFSPQVRYSFDIERNTHKPKLNVSEEVIGGVSYKEVSWSKINDTDTVEIYRDGFFVETDGEGGSLKNVGSYQIKVTDEIGNTQSYYFSIRSLYNNDVIFVVILLLASVFVIIGYLIYYKKSMNVL